MKLLFIPLLALLLLSGCSLQESICIEGENLTYDGVAANGKLRITACPGERNAVLNRTVVLNDTPVNSTVMNESPDLPLFHEVRG